MVDLNSIRLRFVALMVLIISLGLGSFGVWNHAASRADRLSELEGALDATGQRLAASLEVAVWEYNRKQITQIVDAEMNAPFLSGIRVSYGKDETYGVQRVDGQLRPLRADVPADTVRRIPITMRDGGVVRPLGEVDVFATHRYINETLRRDLQRTIVQIVALNIATIVILYLALSAVVLQPLARVREALRRLASGDTDLAQRLPEGRITEFRAVSSGLNAYLEQLEHLMGGSLATVHTSIRNISEGNLEAPIEVGNGSHDSVLGRLAVMRDNLKAMNEKQARSAAELERANDLASHALELTKSGPWHVDSSEPDAIYYSERAARILGEAPHASDWKYDRRTECWDRMAAADARLAAVTWHTFIDALEGRIASFDATYLYERPVDGERVWVHSLGHVERDPHSGATRMLGVVHDITALKQAEIAIVKAKVAAEEASQAKSDFLANMSHEIRTPMNAIIGMSNLALNTDLTPRQRNYVEKVNISAVNLLGILNDILDFSKIEAGKMTIEIANFQLDDVMSHLAGAVGEKADERGIELLFDVRPEVPTALVGDSLRLGQVLLNLVGNALKFTTRGEVVVGADIHHGPRPSALKADELELHFWVRDTGIGMSEATRQSLFQAFTQADSSTSRKYGGTGLGLTISRTLTELMGGRMWVDSALGAGSSFHFTVTVRRQPIARDRRGNGASRDAFRRLRVLIVDDNDSAREILASMTAGLGASVDTIDSGVGAAELVLIAHQRGRPYDLVMMDWLMPGMDGFAATALLQAQPDLAMPRVVMVTAHGKVDAMQSAGARVANLFGVLTKPASASSLHEILARVIDAAVDEQDGPATHPPARDLPDTTRLRGARVLLVEDNDINQELAVELLTNQGMDVEVAGNGEEAIARLDAARYDCVLMDCQMPVLDGYDATLRLRRDPRFANLPIIAMTANAMTHDVKRALDAGMNDHIAKPLDVGLMYSVLLKWVRP